MAEQRHAPRQTVVVIDRRPTIRALAGIFFDYAGYTVLAAENRNQAKDVLTSAGARLSLVLLDPSVIEVGSVLFLIRPGARIILAIDYDRILSDYAERVLRAGRSEEQRTTVYSNAVSELTEAAELPRVRVVHPTATWAA